MLLAFLADIHEDAYSLKQAVDRCESLNVDRLVCLGDMVGYSVPFYSFMKERHANDVIDIIRSNCHAVVIGNHDLFAVRKLPSYLDADPRYDRWYALDFDERSSISNGSLFLYEENELATLLNKRNRCYLESLPEHAFLDVGPEIILLSHYAFPDSTGCMTNEVRSHRQLTDHFAFMSQHGSVVSFSGNDHLDGFHSHTPTASSIRGFERVRCDEGPHWIHGPAIARGTTRNGFLTFDTITRELEAVELGGGVHQPPTSI